MRYIKYLFGGLLFLLLSLSIGSLTSKNTFKESNEVVNNVMKENNTVEVFKDVVIKNIQDDTREFNYTYVINIEDLVGAVKYSINGNMEYTVFNAKGEASIIMTSNDTLVLYDIPIDRSISVVQTTNENYKVYIDGNNTNKFSGVTGSINDIEFNNNSNSNVKNPNTIDRVFNYVILAISLLILIISLSQVKVKKFTEM